MSHACTVISCLVVVEAYDTKRSLLLECNISDLTDTYVEIMRASNALYHDTFDQGEMPFLSTYDVVSKCSQLNLLIPQHGEIGFIDADDGKEKVEKFLQDCSSCPAGMVFTSVRRSVAL
jgi:hypothetical protein